MHRNAFLNFKQWPSAATLVVCVAMYCGSPSKSVAQAGQDSMPPAAGKTLFDKSISDLRVAIDKRRASGVPVPVPKDAGGGYTHEQHKQNGKTIYEAGMLYQLTGEKAYLDFATRILSDYAELYPTLGLHPKVNPKRPSRLFWQGLNEAVWLVYVIQG